MQQMHSSAWLQVMAPNRKIFALKRIKLQGKDSEASRGFVDEITLLQRLRGKQNIIQLVDAEVCLITPTATQDSSCKVAHISLMIIAPHFKNLLLLTSQNGVCCMYTCKVLLCTCLTACMLEHQDIHVSSPKTCYIPGCTCVPVQFVNQKRVTH